MRNVEKVGANVALIGDTDDDVVEKHVMADDGSGHSINIPSFLISKYAAQAFKEKFFEGAPIILKVEIDSAPENNVPEIDLWYSTPFDLFPKKLMNLKSSLEKFENRIKINFRARSKRCLFCPA